MPTTITPQDYTAFLAMIKHEGENGIANLLKQGRDGDALGYVSGLIDTWTNRASAAGLQPWQMMNRPSQITDWNTDTSWIQNKANSLPSNIKQLADAYLSARAEGAPQLNPGVNFYLNKDLVEATPAYGTKWKNWYDQSSVVNSFGDQRGGGRGSLQTQFVANPNEYQAKDTGIVFDKSLKVQPTDFGQGAYAKITGAASMGYDPARALNTGTTGLNTFDASEGAGPVNPGMVSDLGRPYETGNPFGFGGADVSSSVAPGFNNLGGAIPYGNVNPLAFGSAYNVGGGRPGAFTDFLPPVQTGDPFGFTGLDTGGGVGNGSFGSGVTPYGSPPGSYDFAGGFNPSQGVGNGVAGQLPPGFDGAAYLRANTDVAAAGMDPAVHYLNFGMQEGRALTPEGWAQTQGPPGLTPTGGAGAPTPTFNGGLPTSTIGAPAATGGLPPGFNEQLYFQANPDVAASGQSGADHFMRWGQFDVRALAPGEEARVHAAPGSVSPYGGTVQASTFGAPQPTQTFGPGSSVDVMSAGLVPTQGPPGVTPTQGPGPTITARPGTFNGDQYLQANGDVAAAGMDPLQHFLNYGYREGRAIDTLGNHFNGNAYLAANQDVATAGLDPLAHFLRYGSTEARTLAPTDWASTQGATTEVTPQGASWLASTYGPSETANTYGIPGLSSTIGAPSLTPTIGAPGLTPTYSPPATTPSWSPFNGAGIGNAYNFSSGNFGGGLGAGPQTFGSYYPAGDSPGTAQPATGPDMSNPFGFTAANVGGFDVNAYGGGDPGAGGGVNEMGISGGFDSEGAMRRVLEQQAADLRRADQAAKTTMHSDPNSFNAILGNGGNVVGFGTPLQNPGAVAAPAVPNLTVSNLALGAPGAMFGMFAPWR